MPAIAMTAKKAMMTMMKTAVLIVAVATGMLNLLGWKECKSCVEGGHCPEFWT